MLIFTDDYSSGMFKISIAPLFSSAESLFLVCQERHDAETAQRVISQTFIYRPCAAPCQKSQYLHLHKFILYVTADSVTPYIWARNCLCACACFLSFTIAPAVCKVVFSVKKRQHTCAQNQIHKKWFAKSRYWF